MTTREWPDLAGRIIEFDDSESSSNKQVRGQAARVSRGHVLPVRVYFEDTDFSGLVYHGSYVRWCERGRSDFLRLLGTDHRQLIDGSSKTEPAAFVVRHMSFDFRRPARIDEILEVITKVVEIGAASLTLEQTITCEGKVLVVGTVTVVLVSMTGKPMRISQAVRESFARASAK